MWRAPQLPRGRRALVVPDGGVGALGLGRVAVRVSELQRVLIAVFVGAQFSQRDLGFDPSYGALLVGQTVGLRGDVDGDVGRVGQQLVQVLLLTGAHALEGPPALQGPAVGVLARVALLAVRH